MEVDKNEAKERGEGEGEGNLVTNASRGCVHPYAKH